MNINRRDFLATGTLGGAAIIGAQAQNPKPSGQPKSSGEVDALIKTNKPQVIARARVIDDLNLEGEGASSEVANRLSRVAPVGGNTILDALPGSVPGPSEEGG